MKIVTHIENYQEQTPSILTIGTFDGVHVGHQKIIADLVHQANKKKHLAVVLTFFPHPRMVLQKDIDIKLIDTVEEKQEILASLGVDVLVIHPFSKKFSRLTSLEFIRDLLVNTFKISKVIIGYDHRFGRNREASIKEINQYGGAYGFEVEEIPVQEISSVNVSSSKIRNALKEGDLKKVNTFLNRPYQLSGIVTPGAGLGRTIDFPTANIKIKETYKLCPPNGVYCVQSKINNKLIQGMMNIGMRPTLDGKTKTIEVHFFDFSQNLYDQSLTIEILYKIREEQKFDSLDDLQIQLEKDKKNCLQLFDSESFDH